MRRLMLVLPVLALACAGPDTRPKTAVQAPYQWRNAVVGGGGFVSGLLFHPRVPGLAFARTDVGGAYRWEADSRVWTALDDSMDRSLEGMDRTGVLALALDPADPDRFYMATGIYTQDWWGVKGGTLYASTDQGRSFSLHPLPFKLGGNNDGRGCGERLQVDPKDPARLVLGSTKDGLWQSPDRGASWTRLESFQPLSTTFVFVDDASPRLLVGVADPALGLLESRDNGKTWARLKGFPAGLMALRWAKAGRRLLVTASDSVGPNNASKGAVLSLDLGSGKLTTLPLPAGQGGFGGVDIDARDPQRVIVSTLNRWQPGDEIFLSRDGGKTWTEVLRSGRRDPLKFPWVAEHTPHWIADVKLDPHDRDRALFVTGYGVWASRDLARAEGPVTWAFENAGLEETVPLELVSPPWGATLYSAMGDQSGFSHWDLGQAPGRGQGEPKWGTCHSVATSWTRPGVVARVGWYEGDKRGTFSTDAGKTWTYFPSQATSKEPGRIAVGTDGKAFVWCPGGMPCARSTDQGETWTEVKDLPADVNPEADSVDPNLFYAMDLPKGVLYVSRDQAASFQALPQAFPANNDRAHVDVRVVPGLKGHVWVSLDQGLYASKDGGRTFTRFEAFDEAGRLGFGAAAPGARHPSAYAVGKVAGVYGFYRSDNGGASWVRFNDAKHQFGYINAISGDSRVHGRVYLATGGRGILVGEASARP